MFGDAATAVPRLVENAMSRYRVPGIVVLATGPAGARYAYVAGADARGRSLDLASIFPIASITKLATALLILQLTDRSRLDLDAPVAEVIPDAAAAKLDVTARLLLSHSSGLPYDLPRRTDDQGGPSTWRELAARCLQTTLVAPPATIVQYSNVGYGLLAMMAERILGLPIQQAITNLVFRPLGIEASLGRAPDRPPIILSDVRGPSAGTDTEMFNTVHWYELGLPWSGATATADATITLLKVFGGQSASLIRPETAGEARQNQTANLAGGFAPPLTWTSAWWGLGPDLKDHKRPHWTPATASPETFGHAGASGVLVYHDPDRELTWSILGSRTADNGWLLVAGPMIASALLGHQMAT